MSTAKAVDDDEPSAAAVVGAAKGRLVSAMMKKHLCEGVVPVIIDLKRLLEARRHPLLGDLMAAIRALLKDYKSEVPLLVTRESAPVTSLTLHMMFSHNAAGAACAAHAHECSCTAHSYRCLVPTLAQTTDCCKLA